MLVFGSCLCWFYTKNTCVLFSTGAFRVGGLKGELKQMQGSAKARRETRNTEPSHCISCLTLFRPDGIKKLLTPVTHLVRISDTTRDAALEHRIKYLPELRLRLLQNLRRTENCLRGGTWKQRGHFSEYGLTGWKTKPHFTPTHLYESSCEAQRSPALAHLSATRHLSCCVKYTKNPKHCGRQDTVLGLGLRKITENYKGYQHKVRSANFSKTLPVTFKYSDLDTWAQGNSSDTALTHHCTIGELSATFDAPQSQNWKPNVINIILLMLFQALWGYKEIFLFIVFSCVNV